MKEIGKVLALDYGKKRVGVASGDADFRIAFPRAVIENKGVEKLVVEVQELCVELEVDTVVVGLPLNMDREEEENEMVQEVRYFVKELRNVLGDINVEFFDERLSSFEAKDLLDDANEKAGKEKLGKDAYAAQVILQRFFDKLRT
ncbi:MAG: Holliday junction resolvase RuvX [Nitrospirae bacterium]|nr:Holliday junction resolvase RuvX [Nitrospirota bacterium]